MVRKVTRQATRQPSKPVTVKDLVLTALLSMLLIWLIYLNVGIFRKEQVAQSAARNTQLQLASLQSRQKTLEENMNELSTERGQEETLRETYGVAKPGEGVIVVVPPTVASTTPKVSFWQKWFSWMKFW